MQSVNRRDFLKLSTMSGGGLLISMQIPGLSARLFADPAEAVFQPSAWLKVFPDNRIVFILDKTEMGQGVMTSLPMLLCEELEVSPEQLVVEAAPAGPEYLTPGFGMQITGGSSSVRTSFEPLRQAGATARLMFIQAASVRWGVSVDACYAESGRVHEKNGSRVLSYGDLVTDVLKHPVPTPVLKKREDFNIIGKSRRRLDGPMKATGTATFGIDVHVDKLYFAYVVRSPYVGGELVSFDGSDALKRPGVKQIFAISSGVAVVAESYWKAKQAASIVTATWRRGAFGAKDTEAVYSEFRAGFADSGKVFLEKGDPQKAYKAAGKLVESEYVIPYMAHATMEPMNCTAQVLKDRCDVWAPTQGTGLAHFMACEITGLPGDKVFIHQTLMGGGFGRRIDQDFVSDAVQISKQSGLPVKMIMSREDDMRNDCYRPGNVHRLKAGLDEDGALLAWEHKAVGPSIMAQFIPKVGKARMPSWLPHVIKDFGAWLGGKAVVWRDDDTTSIEGASDLSYAVPNVQVSYVLKDPGVPVGFWRSVGHSFTGFVVESFVDECAHAAGRDPLDYRLNLLKDEPRRRKVLEAVAEKAQWKKLVAEGRAVGIAQTFSFGSYAAQVAEVEIKGNDIVVKRVVCVLDCGFVVNPDNVIAQVESAIIFALSAALKDGISFKDGAVEQDNFDTNRILRMDEVPQMEVFLVEGEDTPQGAGEPAVPPLAAAVANAVFVATKKRLKSLPLRLS